MKRISLAALIITALGTLVFIGCNKAAPEPQPAETVSNVTEAPAPAPVQEVVATKPQPRVVLAPAQPAPVAETTPAAAVSEVDTNALYQQALDRLTSTNSTFRDRAEAMALLKSSGRLKDAILDMETQAKASPDNAELPAMIGQAMLQAINPDMDIQQKGILALGADERFDQALKTDPNNWDANYYKAASLGYWPADMNKGPEVVQRFTDLIQQQENMTAQPQFVRSYISLGDYYMRSGNNTAANQIWQRGLSQFPGDPGLTKRLNGQ
jgi:tetratricopeptide (TPR) repeat protein